jgi:hypothetical protein
MPSPLLRSAAFLILASATATASPAPSLFSLPPNWLESLSTTPATNHPRFPVVIPSLGPLAPIDARLALANAGVTLADDEVALISSTLPDSRSILFLRANQLTTDLVATIAPGGFVDDFGRPYASIRLWFTESSPSSPPRSLLDQSIVCIRGGRSTFARSRPGTLDVQSEFAFSGTELPDIVSIESSGHVRTHSFSASWSGESSVYATNPSGTIIWKGNGSSPQSSAVGRLSLTFLPDTFDSRTANAIDAEIRATASQGFPSIQSDLLPAPPDLSAEESCAFIEPGTATPNAPRLVDARRWLASRGITTQPGESAWLVPRFGLLYVSARGPTRNAINGLVLHSYPPSALNLQLRSPSIRLFRNIPLHPTDGTVSGRVSGLPFSPDADVYVHSFHASASLTLGLVSLPVGPELWSIQTETSLRIADHLLTPFASASSQSLAPLNLTLSAAFPESPTAALLRNPARKAAALRDIAAALNPAPLPPPSPPRGLPLQSASPEPK